ncbi:hypothetical protein GQ53DRAFT_756098 [Thozetella sp. PMI_491]|nr:hypothetical protein GQ53DRAFT_756098 [Thozetella sp. PMI_491]
MSAAPQQSQTPVPETTGPVVAPDSILPTNPDPTTASPSATQKELQSRAEEYVKQEKFTRTFKLPATAQHAELTVSYAIGGVDSPSAPTVLFISGMYGGRFLASFADYPAEKMGMRAVVVDRPGLGLSTPVDASLRLSVWLETVPELMRVLGAKHLFLMSHSCGVIYALNTVHAMPWILPPTHRKLYLFSPWVSPDHSGVTMLSISSHLPSPLINSFDGIMRFVRGAVVPTWQFSGMISGMISTPFAALGKDDKEKDKKIPKGQQDELCRKYLGISAAESNARGTVLTEAIFAESTSGANHEALLSLRKEVAGSWGACDNYETYPDTLIEKLRDYNRQQSERDAADSPPVQTPFVIKAIWAETDIMIEKKGEQYFDSCFQRYMQSESSTEQDADRVLLYENETIPETNHESLCLPQYGSLPQVLSEMMGKPVW